MTTELKDGTATEDPRLDRLYEEDLRSLDYLVRNATPPHLGLTSVGQRKPRSYTWMCNLWLDQGVEGACVSAGCGHELAARPVEVQGVTFPWCREHIYFPAQRIDEWPGGSYPGASPRYEGTSVLAGVKILRELGFITKFTWAISLEEAVLGIAYHGPAILGFNWYTGMYNTNAEGYITPVGSVRGGHCLVAIAVKIEYKRWSWGGWFRRSWNDVDLDKSYITLHNSWGRGWGVSGRAKISLRDFDKLLKERGEVCFVERTNKKSV